MKATPSFLREESSPSPFDERRLVLKSELQVEEEEDLERENDVIESARQMTSTMENLKATSYEDINQTMCKTVRER